MSNYEVYIAKVYEVVVYVGEGKEGRHKHITSGVSHCYEANKAHFRGDVLSVEVLTQETKESAKSIELELIQELKPLWNKVDNWQDLMSFRKDVREVVKRAKYRKITNPVQRDVLDYLVGKFTSEGTCTVSLSEMKRDCKVNTGFMSKMQKGREKYYQKLKEFIRIDRLPQTGEYLCTWVYDPSKTSF